MEAVLKIRNFWAALGVVSASMIPLSASATCLVCFKYTGNCYVLEMPCSAFDGYGGRATCFLIGAMRVNPATDYVLTDYAHAWLVQGAKRTPLASKAMTQTLASISRQYAGSKTVGPREGSLKADALAAALKAPDLNVSPDLVAAYAKALNLKVRTHRAGAVG